MNDTLSPPDEAEETGPLSTLPDWFIHREVIPLEDHLALVVAHETMHAIVELCRAIAQSPAPVLLTGETGVGKSLLCRFLHASHDPYAPFVSHLAAGLDAAVLHRRLFSPPEDAESPPPLVAEAAGGTLVLEEMGDLPRAVQESLLAYWDGALAKAQGPGPRLFICTTNTPRKQLLAPGAFAPGFLERLRHIHVPPLRERKEDIPALVAYFSRLQTSRSAPFKSLETLSRRLAEHGFPGNVRELESLMALETGGLPWRWRISSADKECCVRVKPRKVEGKRSARAKK